METRANYLLIGVFTLAVVAGVFGFVYWFQNIGGTGERAFYRIVFDGSVSGLRTGASVLFNGIRVGEVTEMRLTDKPSEVAAVVSITPSTPIRADTIVTLEYAGLTGIASVSLKGATASSPAVAPPKSGGLPTLRAASTAGDMGTAVRETLAKADAIIVENQESLRNTIKNLETFTAALARNGDKIDKLVDNSSKLIETGTEAMGSFTALAVSLKKDTNQLAESLDKRTAEVSEGITKLTDTTTKQVTTVGNNLNRAIINIDKSITDLAKNPQRIIFGGSNDKK